jgi:hypothetical protein
MGECQEVYTPGNANYWHSMHCFLKLFVIDLPTQACIILAMTAMLWHTFTSEENRHENGTSCRLLQAQPASPSCP